jgi:hypothetical protein
LEHDLFLCPWWHALGFVFLAWLDFGPLFSFLISPFCWVFCLRKFARFCSLITILILVLISHKNGILIWF